MQSKLIQLQIIRNELTLEQTVERILTLDLTAYTHIERTGIEKGLNQQ